MNEIITTLEALRPVLTTCTFNQISKIIEATLSMSGRVTMLNISRWAEQGASYRTVQRFFNQTHDWPNLNWQLINKYLAEKLGTWVIIADEVIVTKAGKHTFGLGKFFSSLQKQVVPGLCFLTIALLHVESKKSFPLFVIPIIRPEVKEAAPKAAKPADSPAKPGRPKGSKNKNRAEIELSPFLLFVQMYLRQALELIGNSLKINYFIYDGALGNNGAVQMAKQCGLHLISKLRQDSVLYFPFTGQYSGRGKPRKYGDKLSWDALTEEHLRKTEVDGDIQTRYYQVQVWHKLFADLLNVVIIVKTNLKTGQTAKVLLFSDDLTLSYEKLIAFYQLRFQIEFNFRDAKQYWGLEDFMNIKQTPVNNMANFSLFMVTFSQLLAAKIDGLEQGSMQDLKTVCRARKYTRRIINALSLKSEGIVIDERVFQAAEIGRVHAKAA